MMHVQETDRRLGTGIGSSLDSMLGFSAEAASPRDRPPQAPRHHDDTVRWPLWKSFLFIITFCGAFWAGVTTLVIRLLA